MTTKKRNVDGGYAWVVLGALCLIDFQIGMVWTCIGILTPAIIREIGEDITQTSLVGSTFLGTTTLFGPVSGLLQDRLGHRWTGVVSGVTMLVGLTSASFCTSVTGLIWTFGFVTGLGASLALNVSGVTPGSYFVEKLSVAYGVIQVGGGCGIFLVGPLTIFLLDQYNLSGTLLILGGIMFHVTLAGALLRPNSPPEDQGVEVETVVDPMGSASIYPVHEEVGFHSHNTIKNPVASTKLQPESVLGELHKSDDRKTLSDGEMYPNCSVKEVVALQKLSVLDENLVQDEKVAIEEFGKADDKEYDHSKCIINPTFSTSVDSVNEENSSYMQTILPVLKTQKVNPPRDTASAASKERPISEGINLSKTVINPSFSTSLNSVNMDGKDCTQNPSGREFPIQEKYDDGDVNLKTVIKATFSTSADDTCSYSSTNLHTSAAPEYSVNREDTFATGEVSVVDMSDSYPDHATDCSDVLSNQTMVRIQCNDGLVNEACIFMTNASVRTCSNVENELQELSKGCEVSREEGSKEEIYHDIIEDDKVSMCQVKEDKKTSGSGLENDENDVNLTRTKGQEHIRPCSNILKNALRNIIQVVRGNGFYIYLLSAVFWTLGDSSCMLHLPNYAESKGTTPAQTSMFLIGQGISTIFCSFLSGFAVSDPAIGNTLLNFGCLGMSGLLTIIFPFYSHSYPLQLVYITLYGFYSQTPYTMVGPHCVQLVGKTNLGFGYGLASFVTGLGLLCGPPIASLLYEVSGVYDYSFIFAGCCLLAAAFLLALVPMFEKQSQNEGS